LLKTVLISLLLIACSTQLSAGSLTYPVPQCSASLENEPDGEHILVEGYSTSASPGDPAVPFKDICLVLPPNAAPSSIRVQLKDAVTSLSEPGHDLAPAPPRIAVIDGQELLDWGEGKEIENGRNKLVYARDAFTPASHVELIDVGKLRKWRIARIRFYPYLYNPVAKVLQFCSSGEILVSYLETAGTTTAAETSDRILTELVAGLTANFHAAQNWYAVAGGPSTQAAKQQTFLIVTTNAIAAASKNLTALVNVKKNRGFNVLIATEAQWGGGTGDAAADKIRAYLKSIYASLNVKYVLLIGNPSPISGDVPMKMLWPRRTSLSYREAPSDYYFADLTGNWDRNADGYFGAPEDFGTGGIDRYPEVLVGRIPYYGSISDLDLILKKIVDYESGIIDGSWVKNVLLSMKPSDANTPGYHLGEAIRKDIALPNGFSTTRVYDQIYGLSPAPDYTPCNYSNVLNAWQKHAGFHFWWTHGNETTASDIMYSGQTQALDDSYPSFVFQCSCLNGSPEHSNNLAYSLLKRGAIATTAATRVSWYYPGQTVYTNTDANTGMCYRYAARLIKDHMPCGDAHYQMMIDVPNEIWMNHCVFNLYGDPSVAYAAGPQIAHTPLNDQEPSAAAYSIHADVTSNAPLADGSPTIYWKTYSSPAYSPVPMTRSAGITYTGQISSQPPGSTVYYYIVAADTSNQTAVSPNGAPTNVHSFKVVADTTAPTIVHTPLSDTGRTSGPYVINATITDDRAVAEAKVYYSVNSAAEIALPMNPTTTGAGAYQASIPGPIAPGSIVRYRIVAVDASAQRNTTSSPSSGVHSFVVGNTTRVALYNSVSRPGYFFGTASNNYSQFADALNSDPAQRFEVTVITSLTSKDLADKDALILADNSVAIDDMTNVSSWFVQGKVVMAVESAVCYAAFSGFMWPESLGTNGYGTFWDYNSGVNDQRVASIDPIMKNYVLNQQLESKGNEVELFAAKLPADARVLTDKLYDPKRIYAAYRDVPGKGRIVVLGPFVPLASSHYPLIREAIASCKVAAPRKTITLTDPRPAQDFLAGELVYIAWTLDGPWTASDRVTIEYTTGINDAWKPVAGAEALPCNNRSFAWNTAGLPTSHNYKLRITEVGGAAYDESDKPFAITVPPRIVLFSSPKAGHIYPADSRIQVSYTTSGAWEADDKIALEYSSGAVWSPIPGANALPYETGAYAWDIFGVPAGQYRIRALLQDGSVLGESDQFTIEPLRTTSIKVLSPNGGEVYQAGQPINIRFNATGTMVSDTIKLEYNTSLDQNWVTIPGAEALPADAKSFVWATLRVPGSSGYRIRASINGTNHTDISDGTFSIIRTVKLSEAKWCSDGQLVKVVSKIVTSNLEGRSYVQEPDRSAGLRVRSVLPLDRLSIVTLIGKMTTLDGERVLEVTSIQVDGVGGQPVPFTVTTNIIGGGTYGLQQPVYYYATLGGVKRLYQMYNTNNIGLLLKVSGSVTAVGLGYFYISDGMNLEDGSGNLGVRVTCGPGVHVPSLGQWVTVTGISSPIYRDGMLFMGLLVPSGLGIQIR